MALTKGQAVALVRAHAICREAKRLHAPLKAQQRLQTAFNRTLDVALRAMGSRVAGEPFMAQLDSEADVWLAQQSARGAGVWW